MDAQRLAGIYLNNHLAMANGGVELFRRVARQHRGGDLGADLDRLAEEAAEDRDVLRRLMHRLGVGENRPMTLLGYVGERIGRFKPNGYVVRRSPLADVIELEGMRDAVAAKIAGWQVLRALAVHDPRVTREEVEDLLERAQDQADRLYRLHLRVTEQVLAATQPDS
jgi:hypothetical protein